MTDRFKKLIEEKGFIHVARRRGNYYLYQVTFVSLDRFGHIVKLGEIYKGTRGYEERSRWIADLDCESANHALQDWFDTTRKGPGRRASRFDIAEVILDAIKNDFQPKFRVEWLTRDGERRIEGYATERRAKSRFNQIQEHINEVTLT